MQQPPTRSTSARRRASVALLFPLLACADQDAAPYDPPDGDGGSTTSTEETSGSDATSGPPPIDTSAGSEESAGTTGDDACTVDEDCVEPTAPVCLGGACLGCDHADTPDDSCAAIDPTRAVCGDEGACVQCSAMDSGACTDATPICNEDTHACEGCTEHEQCPGTACDLETGACFSDDCVLYVQGDDDATVTEALETVGPGESCVIIVEALDEFAVLDHLEPATLDVTDGRRIALRGDYATTPPRIYVNDDVLVNVGSLGKLYVSDLRLGPAHTNTVVVDDGTLHLDRTQIDAWGVAVRTTNAASRLRLRNSTLFGDSAADGTLAAESGEIEASFVSILGYEVALTCGATAAVAVRNSLVLAFYSDMPDVDCGTAEISYSGLAQPHVGDGNQSLGPPQAEWFVTPSEDHHLSDEHPALLEVTARWTTGDPLVDLDGDPRPGRDGAMTFAGADAPAMKTTTSVGIGVER